MTTPAGPDPGCSGSASQGLLRGVREFNAGLYFECHETLEELWIAEPGPLRKLYQGVLQVGIALLHRERNNYRGAVALLESGAALLEPFRPVCRQIDVSSLLAGAARLREALVALGPEGFAELDPDLIPKIRLVPDSESEFPPET